MEKVLKSPKKYECVLCDYNTVYKKDYHKHLSTSKHKNRTNLTNLTEEILKKEDNIIYTCDICNKIYKTRPGLLYHKNKNECSINIDNKSNNSISNVTNTNDILLLGEAIKETIKETIVSVVKNNQEFQLQMFELIKDGMSQLSLTNINNSNVNSNNSFNLQFFLNEQCKDAMNMSEFIDSVKVTMNDLENINNVGYVKGMSTVIVRELRELDVYKRPIHCSDSKREVIHIKENNEWIKDDPSNSILKKSINKIANKHYGVLNEWKDERPGYEKSDSQYNNMFLNLMRVLCGGTEENVNRSNHEKIVKNIIKEVTIDKNALT